MRGRLTIGPSTATLLALMVVLAACRRPAPPLPAYGEVPDFQLTDQHGKPFQGRSLAGKIWVANFMFTSCMGPCPRMTSRLHQVRESVKDVPDFNLVSFTIDPARDTPAVLKQYAQEHAAAQHWYFLTGPQPALHHLCRDVFKLGDVDGSLTHSTRFMLIDQRSQIRGYYDSFDPESLQQLNSDIRAVLRERS